VGKPVRNNKNDALKYVSGVVSLTSKKNDHLIKDHFKENFIETVDDSGDTNKGVLWGREGIMIALLVRR
jgi:hypothetical protein